MQANPLGIPQLLSYVRAGYVPTNKTFANTTYSGDVWTIDANGYPANGTVGPLGYPFVMSPYTSPIQRPAIRGPLFTRIHG